MNNIFRHPKFWLLPALLLAAIVYWPGLSGTFLFDDFPNIVENKGVQPESASPQALVRAALSSPSSEFKRPLASLSFATNYLISGLDPFWMKLTNVLLHLANGLLVFAFVRALLRAVNSRDTTRHKGVPQGSEDAMAVVIATAWLVLPINLTGVLYIVQRMESMANIFVLAGLVMYLNARMKMARRSSHGETIDWAGVAACALSLALPVVVGVLAKETAVMLPLYAATVEWLVFDFSTTPGRKRDRGIIGVFVCLLIIPLVAGLSVILPGLLQPETWAIRDFTMKTRLLTESRIVVDYLLWTVFPTPHSLSFYHDDLAISQGILAPLSTLGCIVLLLALSIAALFVRKKYPLVALGFFLFLGSHALTGTIIPLELVYEHRNYFSSIGVLIALLPWLYTTFQKHGLQRVGILVTGGFILMWAMQTSITARAWGNPLDLSRTLAERAPSSPRALYELGRTYIIYSRYEPGSPFVPLVYPVLERAARLPQSSILPEQALIFFNARMNRPLEDQWWTSMNQKLRAKKPGVQDESSIIALTQCAKEQHCDLPKENMVAIFLAAIAHPNPTARILGAYSDYAWNVLLDRDLALRMALEATQAAPREPAYWITLARMQLAMGEPAKARDTISHLELLNIGGSIQQSINELNRLSETQAQRHPGVPPSTASATQSNSQSQM